MNKKTFLLVLLIPKILLAFCSTINAKENSCRYVDGDSWCSKQEDSLKRFAYKDNCKGASYQIINKYQEDGTWKLGYVNLKTEKSFTIAEGMTPVGYDWVSRDVILVSISCGSPCTNYLFKDLSTNQEFSVPLMIAYNEKYIASIDKNGTVTIREIFGKVIFTDRLNISSVAFPPSAIEKADFKEDTLVIDYLTGKDFKTKHKTVHFLKKKVLRYFTIENKISHFMKALYAKTKREDIEIYSLDDGVCMELGRQEDFDGNA